MSNTADRRDLLLRIPPLDASAAACLLDLCGLLQQAIWRAYGDEIEAHWQVAEPDQPIYPSRPPSSRRRR